MAKITIDQALLASYEATANTAFITRVMDNLEQPKMNTIFASLRRAPKFALALAAVVGVLAISGTAYAAYQLWLKPNASVQQFGQNQEGRDEALVAFKNCQDNAQARYEVKSSASLNPQEIEQLLRARCEMDAITRWADASLPQTSRENSMVYPGAFTIAKIDGTTVSLRGKDSNPTVAITDQTTVVVDGAAVAATALHVGDTVATVERLTYGPEGGSPTSRTLLGLVALQMRAEFYEPSMQNRVAERKTCYGNPAETCVQSGSIDVYPRNGENNSAPVTPGDMFEIQGRIVEHNGNTVRIKASSGAIYTIAAPLDMLAKFNTQNSGDYQGTKIVVGDMLAVRYSQKASDDHKNVQPQQLQSVNLLIEVINKQDPIKKY